MKRLIVLALCSSALAVAGLMDFKTIDEANKAYKDEKYQKSATLWKELKSETVERDYDIGNAYYKAKQYDKALESYEKAKGVDEAQRLHIVGNSCKSNYTYWTCIQPIPTWFISSRAFHA